MAGPYAAAANSSIIGQNTVNLAKHRTQYEYFRDWVYAAIRPIAVRVARQNFKVARKRQSAGPNPIKAARHNLHMAAAPEFIRKEADNLDILESHPLLDAIENPNDLHTGWELKYFTATNISITGLGYWWLHVDDAGQMRIWPLPSSWVTPKHEGAPFAMWEVRPPGSTEPIMVDGEDICRFAYPDPSNPLGSLSPLQANARAVSTDEQIQNSQLQSYKNGVRPSVVLKAGRLPGMPGMTTPGVRPVLTPEQRKQLISAIKLASAGWERHRDPFIVDGLIDEIIPFDRSPHEMDYINSSKLTEDRVWLGFGVNPISAGKREGGNRAQSYAADEHLVSNVINPLISLISQTATKKIGPRFSRDSEKLMVYIEQAQPHDVDLELAKMTFAAEHQAVTKNEIREYVGKPPMKGGDELPQPPQEPPAEAGTQKPGGKGMTTLQAAQHRDVLAELRDEIRRLTAASA